MVFQDISSSREQLLPRIHDEITLGHITTKLSWRDCHILSSVSRAWRQAIKTREVYNARVSSNSTEMLLVVNRIQTEDLNILALYSVRDDVCYILPALPHLHDFGVPWSCQFISLDGRLYVLGGIQKQKRDIPNDCGSQKVYMLDLVAKMQWEECASMLEAREEFGCAVLDGKIYVFGGAVDDMHSLHTGAEVYDPQVDNWSPIRPLETLRFNHQVATVGDELFLHGGQFYDVIEFDIEEASVWEIYHPVKDEWRVVKPPGGISLDRFIPPVFMAQGKFYSMSELGIHRLDGDKWIHQHSISCDGFGPTGFVSVSPDAIVAVGDEVIAMVDYVCWTNNGAVGSFGSCLLKSRGFGSANEDILWHKLQCYISIEESWPSPFLVPIHL